MPLLIGKDFHFEGKIANSNYNSNYTIKNKHSPSLNLKKKLIIDSSFMPKYFFFKLLNLNIIMISRVY